jgi:Flp pilus assembly pilin Flp
VTFFNDATVAEYAVFLGLLAIALMDTVRTVSPRLGGDACTIRGKLEAGLAALGFENPPDRCATPTPTPIIP